MRITLLFIIFSIGTINLLSGQDSVVQKRWELNGYQKFLSIIQNLPQTGNNYNLNFLHNRLQNKIQITENIQAQLDFRSRIFYGEAVKLNPDFINQLKDNAEFLNLSKNWLKEAGIIGNTIIDRAHLTFQNDLWYIGIGRQRVNWGIHNFWNPNDLFNAFNLLDFDYEERPGADVVLVKYFSGINQSFELAIQPSRHIKNSISGLIYKTNWQNYDFQFLAGQYRKDIVGGIGWAGAIQNVGLKGESSIFIPHTKDNQSDKPTMNFSLMADYTFGKAYYSSFAILYQSNETSVFNEINFSQLSPKQLFPFNWTSYASISKTFDDRYMTSAGIMYSPLNKSLILLPSFGFQITQDMETDLTGQLFWLNNGTRLNSLLNAIYLRMRYSY